MNKLVSVIMPCYNDGAYIHESVESVWKQVYSDIELIVIDDGSDDPDTIRALDELKKDQRCTVLHTEHLGPSGARNEGIRKAKGKYILPLDADDLIDETYIQKAVCAIEETPNRGVVYCMADLFGAAHGPWELPPYSFEQMLRDNIVFITALFYREDWERIGGFKTNMKKGMEDYDFWIGILEIGREIYQIPEVLFHYRIKQRSRTTLLMDNMDHVKEMYRHIYDNHPVFYQKYQKEYAQQLRETLIEQIFLVKEYERRINGGGASLTQYRIREAVKKTIRRIPVLHEMARKIKHMLQKKGN
ncbi:MAG: glycosyltransferase family 2 protein [Clostridia bacterium]|nr:glycosyltransferase family 2 protein [Clostridia bacterium]